MGEATPTHIARGAVAHRADPGPAAVAGALAELLERCREEARAARVEEVPGRWASAALTAPDPSAGYRGWSGI